MSKKLLKKLSSIITENKSSMPDGDAAKRLIALEEHLDLVVAASHGSVHASNHHSTP